MSAVCLDDELLLDVAEGRRPMHTAAEAHLAVCSECRRTFAAIARGRGSTIRDTSPPEDDEPGWDELGQGVVVGRRYELDSFLGAGGMGVVWRARRVTDGAVVALKIARGADPELCRRFEREATVLAALQHPHIVRVFEILAAHPDTRGPVIVQELLRGESLEMRLARVRRMRLDEACRMTIAVASALGTAHARGIVHRDLKPANVFLTTDGRVVVLDFGMAKLLPEWGTHTKLTRTGAVVGSPRYMAPEQVFGETADARADVWALGALLFRTLAGRVPVEADGIGEILKALQRGAIPDLAAFAPTLPADVLALTHAALTVDRQKRFHDVARFEAVLSRYVRT